MRMTMLVAGLAAWPVLATAGATEDLVRRLGSLDSLQGQFEQTILDQGGSRLQEARGEMTLTRGNRFYWHTLEPFEQLAVSDGDTLWVYDVDLAQVVEKPMGDRVANTPALLFSGDPSSVADAFSVEEAEKRGDSVTYRLKPRAEEPLFENLEVRFDGKLPVEMRLEDALGQQTVIDFRNLRLNQPVAAELFDFRPPADADVIRQAE